MLTTCILTLIMCALLFLMIWSAAYFLPWKGLMDFFPETDGCAGYHSFGFNRTEQIRQIIMMPFAALLTAWICTLF